MAENHPGTRAHALATLLHFRAIPMTTYINQNIVGLGLAVETGARRPKRRVSPGLVAIAEQPDDVIGRPRQHDNLGNESVGAGIGGIPDEINGPVEDFLFSQQGDEIGLEASGGPVDQGSRDGVAHGRPVKPSHARGVRGE